MVSFPAAAIPTTQLSLLRSMDPCAHLALGAALAPLRDEGVLIIGSAMSYHNMRGLKVRCVRCALLCVRGC
jgi:aromatic ring-opening dioxygenase catalytic subunit (LigB family)